FVGRAFLPIFVAAVAMFVWGALWYSPVMFARPWMKAMGLDPRLDPNDQKMTQIRRSGGVAAYGQTLLFNLFIAWVFSRLFYFVHTPNGLHGAHTAFFIALATVVPAKYTATLFGQGNMRLFAIDAGFHLTMYTLMGAILGAWHG